MAGDELLDRIRSVKAQRKQVDVQLRALVNEAFDSGHTWQEIAKSLGVSKARVYQIRKGTR